MNDDMAGAVLNNLALRDLHRASVGSTSITPADPEAHASSGAIYFDAEALNLTAGGQAARTAYVVAADARWTALKTHQRSAGPQRELTAKVALCGWGALLMAFNQDVGALVASDAGVRSNMTFLVNRHEMRLGPTCSFAFRPHDHPAAWAGLGVEVAPVAVDWPDALVTFNVVEPVEQHEATALRLFAELQNGAALGRASAQRLRELQEVAREEGEPFSLEALEALVAFAGAYPEMPTPELTVGADGGILAEWRSSPFSVAIFFINVARVQYLVKRLNPRHSALVDRSSGTTSIDVLGDRLRALLPQSAWPIRA